MGNAEYMGEKALKFRKSTVKDMTEKDLSSCFATFCLPEKEEGFDDIKYEWDSSSKSADYLKAWILERKNTQRVDDLKPSSWFRKEWDDWTKHLSDWKRKMQQFKNPPPKQKKPPA